MGKGTKPKGRSPSEAEAALARAAEALQAALPAGTAAVLFVSLDGDHIDCVQNLGGMEPAAAMVRGYLDSLDEGRATFRDKTVLRIN